MKSIPVLILLISVSAFLASCIKLASPKQTVIKASSTLELEDKSSNWLHAQSRLQVLASSSESGLPNELNSSIIWTFDIRGRGGVPVIAKQSLPIWVLWRRRTGGGKA